MLDSVSALPGDAHPYVWSSEGNNTGFDPTSINTPGSTNYTGFWSPSAVPTTLVNGRAAFYCKYFTGTNQDTIVRIPYQDLITGKDILFPIAWGAFNAPPGTTPGTWKGVSNSCYWSGGSVVGTADIRGRQAGDTGSITSTRDTLYFPPFAFQWDGSDPAALLIP